MVESTGYPSAIIPTDGAFSATHIIRANHHHPAQPDLNSSLVVMHVMNRMIDSKTESPQSRTKACFVLSE